MIAIKNMEMPKYCNDCDFVVDSMGYCERANEQIPNYDFFSETNERPNFCPLVEIEERKVGKWVKKSQYGNDYCSECDYEHCGYGYPNYCPNCGAEMRVGE